MADDVGLSDLSPVPPSHDDWNAWATLSNDVTTALKELGPDGYRPFFSSRTRVARVLWDLGYRPNEEQVDRVRKRQQQVWEE